MTALLQQPQTAVMYKCDEPGCTRRFNRKYTLAEHMKSHTGERPHICPVKTCAKSFSTSGNLSRHKRLHGYIEPLPCPVQGCVCTFPSNNKLEKHMKFHFANDVKVCLVPGCGKTFSTTGNLNRHVKTMHGDNENSCSSPSASSVTSTTRSPTAADQWDQEPHAAGEYFGLEGTWIPAPVFAHAPAQYALSTPVVPETNSWGTDVFDALASILDDQQVTSMMAMERCNFGVFQSSLQYPSYTYRC
uniref:C2H2-type domain-containing protein n=1 Tax=Globisporangium ultimum (strain ATCC 200006 / CBS 805.95 / DAOM BR144) TaxID=431595 RepID=K3WUW9_GLOUD